VLTTSPDFLQKETPGLGLSIADRYKMKISLDGAFPFTPAPTMNSRTADWLMER